MSNSIEWQIMDYQMWAEAQDWKHDAPRYYANELRLKEIEKILTNNANFEIIGIEVAKVMDFFEDKENDNVES